MDTARSSTFATFENCKQHYNRLVAVEGAYTRLIYGLDETDASSNNLFLLAAHAAYLSGTQLACGGQLPPCYMVLRGCLENALYASFFHSHPNKKHVWERRHDSPENARQVRDEFRIGQMLSEFGRIDPSLGPVVRQVYELAIDLGAHPNVWGLYPHLSLPKDGWQKLRYITDDVSDIVIGLQNCARVGICSLGVFRHMFEKKFADLGISAELDRLKRDL